MESELSGIFRVKLATKNIERGSPETQFIHMRVNKNKKRVVSALVFLVIKMNNISIVCVK